jgi:tRNA(Ile)-lysidine synthase TilS/MesJ
MAFFMEKCAYCGRESVIVVTLPLCKNHFMKYFERKLKRTIKKYNLINPKKRVVVIDVGDASSSVVVYLMERFYPNVVVIHEKDKSKIIKRNDQVAISHNLDDEAELIMTSVAQDDKKKLRELGPKNNNTVKPLYHCTQEEIDVYAKLKKLKFKKGKTKKTQIKRFLDDFDKRYKGIKHSIVSSYLDIMPVIKKRLLKEKK